MRSCRLAMRESSAATALALRNTRSCAWIAVVETHHAAIRSSSHSSMKAENWFQLRNVGVTSEKPGFGWAFSMERDPRFGHWTERLREPVLAFAAAGRDVDKRNVRMLVCGGVSMW